MLFALGFAIGVTAMVAIEIAFMWLVNNGPSVGCTVRA